MRFMNDYDIEMARRTFADHPVLAPAVEIVANLRDWANQNSDGWAYWPKPCRAAAKLIELIERDGTWEARYGAREDATEAELKAALRPIKAFLTRQGVSHSILTRRDISVQDFKPGTQYLRPDNIGRDVTVTILRNAEPSIDRFGRDMLKFWARREDTKQEGYVTFGPDGVATAVSAS